MAGRPSPRSSSPTRGSRGGRASSSASNGDAAGGRGALGPASPDRPLLDRSAQRQSRQSTLGSRDSHSLPFSASPRRDVADGLSAFTSQSLGNTAGLSLEDDDGERGVHKLLMGESLEDTQTPLTRRGPGGRDGAHRASRALDGDTQSLDDEMDDADRAIDDWNKELSAQRGLGEVGNQDRIRNFKELTEGFSHAISGIKEVNDQLNDLVNEAMGAAKKGVSTLSPTDAFLAPTHQRLILPVTELTKAGNIPFARHPLIVNPWTAVPALEAAVAEEWRDRGVVDLPPPRVGLSGWLGSDHVTPRGLDASRLKKLVCVEGVVNRCTVVQPRLKKAVYVREPGPGREEERIERSVHVRHCFDITDLNRDTRDEAPPLEKDETRVNRQEIGFCEYINSQRFVVQETPETAPTGQMPRWVDIIVEGDLCETVKCGDRVRVWGVYRPKTGPANAQNNGIVKPFLVANNIQVKDKSERQLTAQIVESDAKGMQELAQREDLLNVLAHSFAPSICGLELVKKGLLLMLAGGAERLSESGHRIRGDVHTLLVGDPSCGKSQLLRYVMSVMPGTVSTTGRGSSGVGLTAAVVSDADTSERRVEGGAMVMADRNVVCIDEFDKMHQSDRVAIHEVMEQQTVTVAKAGIHTTLNARCSVLAAANPLYGCWADDIDHRHQLTFEDSLMSRFDLIFIVRDSSSKADDDRIADAVLRNVTQKAVPICSGNRSSRVGGASVQIQPDRGMDTWQGPQQLVQQRQQQSIVPAAAGQEGTEGRMFCQRYEMAYSDRKGKEHDVLTTDFLGKYLSYAKSEFYRHQHEVHGWATYPELSREAFDQIIEFYATIRQRSQQPGKKMLQSVTPRTLEGIVRLATAHARLRLRRYVTSVDVKVIESLLLYTLFGEEEHSKEGDEEEEDEDTEMDDDDEDDDRSHDLPRRRPSERTSTARRSSRRASGRTSASGAAEDDSDDEDGGKAGSAVGKRTRARGISPVAAEDVLTRQMEEMGLDEAATKRRRTRHSAGLEGSASQGIDNLEKWILQALREMDRGSGVEEGPFAERIAALAKEKGALQQPSKEEIQNVLTKISNMDSPPLLYTDGRIYEC